MSLTVGSLFSGIGGLDLGLERAGMRVIWQSEIDPYACRVLNKHWPEVINHGNIKEIKWQEVERPDVICGGYPCQPFSQAGKRRGEEDPRHLWPWVREAISELRPRYAILENVRGHLSMGGLSVIGELAAIGYDAEWRVVSAASVGANHRRDRIIIVAYPDGSHSTNGRQREDISSEDPSWRNDRGGSGSDIGEVGVGSTRQNAENVANADDAGARTSRSRVDGNWEKEEQGWDDQPFAGFSGHGSEVADASKQRWEECGRETPREIFASNARRSSSNLGLVANWWTTEPDVGRVANGISSRVDRLKGLGNAVVPQVAEVVGRLVMEHAA